MTGNSICSAASFGSAALRSALLFAFTAPLVKKRLLRSAERSKRKIKNKFSAEDAQSVSGGHFKSSAPRVRQGFSTAFCKKIRLQWQKSMVK